MLGWAAAPLFSTHMGVLQAASPGPPQPSADDSGSADAKGVKKKEKGGKRGSAKGGRPQFTVGRGAAMLQTLVEASMRQRLAAAAQPAADAGVEPLSGMVLHQQVKEGAVGGPGVGRDVIVADLQHQLFEERQLRRSLHKGSMRAVGCSWAPHSG